MSEKDSTLDYLDHVKQSEIICQIRGRTFRILEQKVQTNDQIVEDLEKQLSRHLVDAGFEVSRDSVRKMLETTLVIELIGVLKLDDLEVAISRSGGQDQTDTSFIVHLSQKAETEKKSGPRDGGGARD